jgi:hypothetical protein
MRWMDVLKLSWRSILLHLFESFLVVVTIGLGVGLIIGTLPLLVASSNYIERLSSMRFAKELTLVSPLNDESGFFLPNQIQSTVPINLDQTRNVILGLRQLQDIRTQSQFLTHGYINDPVRFYPLGQDLAGANGSQKMARAVTAEYIDASELKLLAGNWPSRTDFLEHRPVIAVLDWAANRWLKQTATQPAHFQPIIGKTIRLTGGLQLRIVAVFSNPTELPEYANPRQPRSAIGLIPFASIPGQSPAQRFNFLAQPGQDRAAMEELRVVARRILGTEVSINSQRQAVEIGIEVLRYGALATALFASGGLVIAILNIFNLTLARLNSQMLSVSVSRSIGLNVLGVLTLFACESAIKGILAGAFGTVVAWTFVAVMRPLLSGSSFFATLEITLLGSQIGLTFVLSILCTCILGMTPVFNAINQPIGQVLRDNA